MCIKELELTIAWQIELITHFSNVIECIHSHEAGDRIDSETYHSLRFSVWRRMRLVSL